MLAAKFEFGLRQRSPELMSGFKVEVEALCAYQKAQHDVVVAAEKGALDDLQWARAGCMAVTCSPI